MSHTRFQLTMSLITAMTVVPLAFGQNPPSPGSGDTFNTATTDNSCLETFNQTKLEINAEYQAKVRQLVLANASCKTDQGCVIRVQQKRKEADDEAQRKVLAAKAVLDDCQSNLKSRGKLLKGGVEMTLEPERAKAGPYIGNVDEYGKALPSMTGQVVYHGTTLTVTTPAGLSVRQGMKGPVAFTSEPRTYSRAEGIISSSSEFRITRLWDLDKKQVLAPQETISVPIFPKR